MKKLFAVLVAAFVVTCFFGCNKIPTTDISYDVSGQIFSSGGVLAGVKVFVNGKEVCLTADDGSFSLSNVKHGSSLSFEKEGYVFPTSVVTSARRDLAVFGIKLFVPKVTVLGAKGGTTTLEEGTVPNSYRLTATPAEDYVFTKWLLDGEFFSSDPSFEITLTDDAEFTACFEKVVFDVSIETEYPSAVSGAGKYRKGETARLVASDTADAEFAGWFKGDELLSSEHELLLEITSDVTLDARFLKRLTFESFSLSGTVLSWSAPTAERIDVFINGSFALSTTETSVDLSDVLETSGTYVIKAVAFAAGYGRAEKEISFVFKLPVSAPYNLGADFEGGVFLSFQRINSATDYKIFVDGQMILLSEHPELAEFSNDCVRFRIDDFLTVGKRTEIYVVAAGSEDRADSKPSDSIFVVLVGELNPPQVKLNGTVVSWTKLEGHSYFLTVNGVAIPLDGKSTVDLAPYLAESGIYEVILTVSAENYKSAATTVYITK